MKLIKAFVRTSHVDEVVRALEDAGAPGITISRVHGVGYGYEPLTFTLAPSECRKALEIAKLEIVCLAKDTDRLVEMIARTARTGVQGDGIVFVTPVERAVKIRTSNEGPMALGAPGDKR